MEDLVLLKEHYYEIKEMSYYYCHLYACLILKFQISSLILKTKPYYFSVYTALLSLCITCIWMQLFGEKEGQEEEEWKTTIIWIHWIFVFSLYCLQYTDKGWIRQLSTLKSQWVSLWESIYYILHYIYLINAGLLIFIISLNNDNNSSH